MKQQAPGSEVRHSLRVAHPVLETRGMNFALKDVSADLGICPYFAVFKTFPGMNCAENYVKMSRYEFGWKNETEAFFK